MYVFDLNYLTRKTIVNAKLLKNTAFHRAATAVCSIGAVALAAYKGCSAETVLATFALIAPALYAASDRIFWEQHIEANYHRLKFPKKPKQSRLPSAAPVQH